MTMAENLSINGGMQSMEVCGDGAHSEAGMNEQPSLLRLPPTEKVVLDVEVCLKPTSTARPSDIKGAVESMLEKRCLTYTDGSIPLTKEEEPYLLEHVHSICLCDSEVQAESGEVLLFWQVSYKVHVYQLNEDGPGEEIQESESIASFQEWLLPAKELHGLWERYANVVHNFASGKGLKQRLLRYAASALLFADKGVDPHLVSWNRVILLHGPPGSGKTSLCKALAQKLSICFSHRFAQTQLVEVDAHSLFSKWFSESGKLVIKLFQKIHELAEDGGLVFVLLDEVESLAAARQAALSGSEPSDSIRAVNALLTQLDRLKSWSNVVVLTTSNITGAIDLAFVDRADIKVYVGPPSVAARYAILQSCLHELMRVSIISMLPDSQCLLNYKALQAQILSRKEADRVARISAREEADDVYDACFELSNHLLSTADACQGLSGRALRKLPFLAHGQVISSGVCPLGQFIETLHKTVLQELAERSLL